MQTCSCRHVGRGRLIVISGYFASALDGVLPPEMLCYLLTC